MQKNLAPSWSNYGELEGILPYRHSYWADRLFRNENWNDYLLYHKLINNNFDAKVYEEYLIYDTIGMIGSVGGTLGMFIN